MKPDEAPVESSIAAAVGSSSAVFAPLALRRRPSPHAIGFDDATLPEMDALWDAVKACEKEPSTQG